MLLKAGVSIERLCPELRKKLNFIQDTLYDLADTELVITSTYEGNHSPGSLHYANRAIDIRLPCKASEIVSRLKSAFGSDYDIILEPTHIHIEYDPKNPKSQRG